MNEGVRFDVSGQRPLLRWAGGKRWLAEALRTIAQELQPTHYVEPFVGGGAAFFHTIWPSATIGDSNAHLIRCYRGLVDNAAAVRRKLRALPVNRETYLRVAAWRPRSDTGAAARLLYLNRTSYGGIYRENARGIFNVPYSGDRSLAPLLSGARLEDAGRLLTGVSICHGDFEEVIAAAAQSSLIYCDPPYSGDGPEGAFKRYGSALFSWNDQQRLARAATNLADAGALVLVSNADTDAIRTLYRRVPGVSFQRRVGVRSGGERVRPERVFVLHSDPAVRRAAVRHLSSRS